MELEMQAKEQIEAEERQLQQKIALA